MEASRAICTNCRIIVMPKTFKELISIVLEVRSKVVMIYRYECSLGSNYNSSIEVERTEKNSVGLGIGYSSWNQKPVWGKD